MDRFKNKNSGRQPMSRDDSPPRGRASRPTQKSKAGKKAAQTIALSPLVFDARCRLLGFYFFLSL